VRKTLNIRAVQRKRFHTRKAIMPEIFNPVYPSGGRSAAGLTLLEVVFATAIAALAAMLLYPTFMLANSMILANRQKLEAEALAMDQAVAIFNTFNFSQVTIATSLPPVSPPASSLLPGNSEIRTMIVPNTGTTAPYKWDVEVRVKRDRFWPGGKTVTLTNDTVYRVTRYNIGRN
jgi:Tfp pilus assembly protein PilE